MLLDGLLLWFTGLTPESLKQLSDWYAPDARFKDPFNAVQGTAAIEGVFVHMFQTLQAPRFVVTGRIVQGRQCFLVWEFHFRFQGSAARAQTVHGGSHLVFDDKGRVSAHRDYWDAAEELYEKLPLLGSLMRWLKRRVVR